MLEKVIPFALRSLILSCLIQSELAASWIELFVFEMNVPIIYEKVASLFMVSPTGRERERVRERELILLLNISLPT